MKKGNFSAAWAEYLFLILIVVGFIVAFSIKTPLIIYIVSYLAGLQCGIVTYINLKRTRTFPIWLIIGGFLIGFLIGGFKASKLTIIILFVIGIINGHMLLKKNTGFLFKK